MDIINIIHPDETSNNENNAVITHSSQPPLSDRQQRSYPRKDSTLPCHNCFIIIIQDRDPFHLCNRRGPKRRCETCARHPVPVPCGNPQRTYSPEQKEFLDRLLNVTERLQNLPEALRVSPSTDVEFNNLCNEALANYVLPYQPHYRKIYRELYRSERAQAVHKAETERQQMREAEIQRETENRVLASLLSKESQHLESKVVRTEDTLASLKMTINRMDDRLASLEMRINTVENIVSRFG
ncbi:hypothetical protein F4818DRAFT_421601 [Hypoxylon cercidicola]|nr:hypothetical protein F4818DRAFT_421601 [Hypoxylon cercidicola]